MTEEERVDLQQLQVLTNVFVQAIIHSTRKIPYGMRSIARETLIALKASPITLTFRIYLIVFLGRPDSQINPMKLMQPLLAH